MNYILKLTAELETELESLKVNEEISENEYLMSCPRIWWVEENE